MEVEPLKSMKGEKRNNLLYILYYSIGFLICQEGIHSALLLVFHIQLDSYILKTNVSSFNCNTLRCTQKWLFSPRFYWKRWFSPRTPLSRLPKSSRSLRYHSNRLFYSY